MRANEQHFTVGTGAIQILGPNPKRTSLIFSGDGTNTITLSTIGLPTAGIGLQVNTSQTSIAVDRIDMGSRITGNWYAVANNAGSHLTVFEGFT